ncbi:MAG: hypothetical protein HFJ33_03630 [Clostridia bacterium]|nr:hypothetical protein [Clostridia bacterium]
MEEKKKTEGTTKTTTGNTQKMNNIIIIAILAVVIAIIAIVLVVENNKETPKKVVEETLRNFKKGVFEQENLPDLIAEENQFNEEARKLLFEKLEWKVLNEKQEGNTATVEIEITNKDYKTIVKNMMQKALKVAMSGKTLEQEEVINYLIEELKNEEIQTTTSNQTITLENQEGKWKITDEESFVNEVLPGFYEAINNVNG